MEIGLYSLEMAAAREYLSDCLDNGHIFGTLLRPLVQNGDGHCSALLPSGCARTFMRKRDFVESLNVGPMSGVNCEINDFMHECLAATPAGLALFSSIALEGDKSIARFDTTFVFVSPPRWWQNDVNPKRGVLLALDARVANRESLDRACRESMGFPAIAALMAPPLTLHRPWRAGDSFSDEELGALVATTTHILVDAFDEESVLIWSREKVAERAWSPASAAGGNRGPGE